MSSSTKTWLIVSAADMDVVELKILDGQFHTAAQGWGYLRVELPPGIYKVQATAGFQTWSQLISLDEGETENIFVPPLAIQSSAPLYESKFTHKYHERAAFEESRKVHADLGRGSAIFLMLRRYSMKQEKPSGPREHPMTGLTLHDRDGNLIVDLVEKSIYQEPEPGNRELDPWAACNITLDPGYYRLRQELYPEKTIEMPLVAAQGWQLQLFALLAPTDSSPTLQRANLVESSIYYTRYDPLQPQNSQGFDSDDYATQQGERLTEIARQALISRSPVASEELSQLFIDKFHNPMLGILGGHLLLLEKEPNFRKLAIVVENLRRMLGDHPDVDALSLSMSGPQSPYIFDNPPMLRESWQSILKASVLQPWIVPLESLSAEIAPRLWGEGIWMLWNSPESVNPVESTALIRSLKKGRKTFDLTHQETTLVQQLARSRGFEPVSYSLVQDTLPSETPQLDEATAQRLVYTLGVPRGNVDEMIEKISEKAKLYEATRSKIKPGVKRTLEMEKIVSEIRSMSVGKQEETAKALPRLIEDDSAGSRITTLGLLQARPDPQYLPFLLSAIGHSKSAFEQFHALYASYKMLPRLNAEQKKELKAAIEEQRGTGPEQYINPGTDRWVLSENILKKL